MNFSVGETVPRAHADEAAALTQRLHDEGWAPHVTVDRLFQEWARVAAEVDEYKLTVDDYTNDLAVRDAIDVVLSRCSDQFGAWAKPMVDEADQRFAARTRPDDDRLLGRYFRIREDAGWWWRRRPVSGPLANYLDET